MADAAGTAGAASTAVIRRGPWSVDASVRVFTCVQCAPHGWRGDQCAGIWLGTQARLVFDRACPREEAPELLALAVNDLAQCLETHADQLVTPLGSPDVKGAGDHLCRHRWRVKVGGNAIYLPLSAHSQVGGARLPYIWVQGTQLLVHRVAYTFHSMCTQQLIRLNALFQVQNRKVMWFVCVGVVAQSVAYVNGSHLRWKLSKVGLPWL